MVVAFLKSMSYLPFQWKVRPGMTCMPLRQILRRLRKLRKGLGKSSPTTPSIFTGENCEAEREKCTAEPPRAFVVLPWMVLTESSATEPTTRIVFFISCKSSSLVSRRGRARASKTNNTKIK